VGGYVFGSNVFDVVSQQLVLEILLKAEDAVLLLSVLL
jgi:hypothetical protein